MDEHSGPQQQGTEHKPTLKQRTDRLMSDKLGLGPKTRRMIFHYGGMLKEQLAAMLPITLLQAGVPAGLACRKQSLVPLLLAVCDVRSHAACTASARPAWHYCSVTVTPSPVPNAARHPAAAVCCTPKP